MADRPAFEEQLRQLRDVASPLPERRPPQRDDVQPEPQVLSNRRTMPGQGCVFVVDLPMAIDDLPATTAPA